MSPTDVILLLGRARTPGPSGLAFDADGTLWSGDVGEDVYAHACARELFRDVAREPLVRVARAHGLAAGGAVSAVAAGLFAGYLRGRIEDRLMCEVMTWAYAGHTEEELRAIARQAFAERGLATRVRAQLLPILEWARRESLRVVVVSASPRAIIQEALAVIGLEAAEVAGGRAALDGGRIGPRMAEPLPFAEQKVTAGTRALAGHDWLGSFGDNFFDLDMLRAARVAVAVCPKPALLARMSELPGAVRLE